MSFVVVAPELVESAAHDLAGIGSTLGEATGLAAAPTTSIAAAGTDEVSTAIAALFGNHAQEFQALTARAAVFHNEFVGLVTSGAGAYLSTEVANAEQAVAGAVTAPAQMLSGATQNVGGAVAALERGAASLLSGPTQGLFSSSNIAAIEAPYKALVTNTETNLQGLLGASAASPHPLLQQIISNQTGTPRRLARHCRTPART